MKPYRIEPESKAHRIVHEELKIHARVTSALSEYSGGATGSPDFDNALIDLRDQVAEAKPEDIPALVDQMARIAALSQRYGRGRDLPVDPESPYFAHLRLEEGERVRDVLIGKRGFIHRDRQVTIVDWRNAPVSRIYYRYAEGDDYEEEFAGKPMEGMIRARRSVTIEEGQLQRIACPQGTFISEDGEQWQEAIERKPARLAGGQGKAARPEMYKKGGRGSILGDKPRQRVRADKHLPEIAALIDPEQFALITRPESGLVVLQGGAGSGKTTVALHRVAFLNFQMPGRFSGQRMMVVVFTKAMVRYVSKVLPGLGVKGVPVLTAADWLSRRRRKVVPGLPRKYNHDTPDLVTRLKKHPLMLEVARMFVARQLEQVTARMTGDLEGTDSGEALLARWQELAAMHPQPMPRIRALAGWVEELDLRGAFERQRVAAAVRTAMRDLCDVAGAWAEMLTDIDLLAAAVDRCCPGVFSMKQLERLTRWVSDQIGPDGLSAAAARGSSKPARGEGAPPPTPAESPYISLDGRDERIQEHGGRLDRTDDPLLLYMALLMEGCLRPPGKGPIRYEHLVVDEAQDLSAVELKLFLSSTSKLRSITLTGDTAQRTVFDNDFSDWESALERVGERGATTRTLKLSYRSTEPIMELARSIAGGGMVTQEIRHTRGGEPVEIHGFTEQGELVATLAQALRSLVLREPRASVALLARHMEQARYYAAALTEAEVAGVRLVASQDFAFKAGVEVTDVTQPKGLEFDYVVLLDVSTANYPDTLESRHLLHIAATRAAHQLWITHVGKASRLLPNTN